VQVIQQSTSIVTLKDFQRVRHIGTGAYGEVHTNTNSDSSNNNEKQQQRQQKQQQ
jgi:hypothetical protein